MSAAVELERHYRRLLLAYPRDYRERRVEEIVATLLDDAAPGQRRPTWGEVADLVLGGARQRLRVPGFPGVWVAAVLSVFIGGAVGAVGAASIGWLNAGTLPDNPTATRLVTPAFAQQSGTSTIRHDEAFGYERTGSNDLLGRLFVGDDTYTAGYVQVTGYRDDEHSLDAAATALRQSGWRVDALREESDGTTLTASTARLSLEARVRSTDNRLIVVIRRAPPPAVMPLTVVGWLGGAIAGWLFAGALARRAGQQDPMVQLFMQGMVISGLVFLAPATALTTVALAEAVLEPRLATESPPWSAYMYPILHPLALIGMVFAIVAAGLATLASPAEPLPQQAPLTVLAPDPPTD